MHQADYGLAFIYGLHQPLNVPTVEIPAWDSITFTHPHQLADADIILRLSARTSKYRVRGCIRIERVQDHSQAGQPTVIAELAGISIKLRLLGYRWQNDCHVHGCTNYMPLPVLCTRLGLKRSMALAEQTTG